MGRRIMRPTAIALVLMLSSAMLSGCIWDDEVTTNVPEVEDDGFRAFSVVAPIDPRT